MRHPTGPRILLLAAFALLTVFAGTATAQSNVSVSVNPNLLDRTVGTNKGSASIYRHWINRADCRGNDVLSFSVTVTGAVQSGSRNLEVWASSSSDCKVDANRGVATNACWLVYQKAVPNLTSTVPVRAQNIVAQRFPSQSGALGTGGASGTGGTGGSGGTSGSGGTATGGTGGDTATGGTGGTTASSGQLVEADGSVCEKNTSFEKALTLYFMIVENSQVVGTPDTWTQTGVDIAPPQPPTNVAATPGENRLLVNWETDTISDFLEWRLYCDPPPGNLPDAGLISATSDFGAARQALEAGVDGSAGTGGAVATGGATATGGALATGGSAASGGATASGGAPGLGGADAGPDSGAGGTIASTGGTVAATGGSNTGSGCTGRSSALVPGKVPPESNRCGTITSGTNRNGAAEGLQNNVRYAVGVLGVDKAGNVGDLSALACGTPILQTDFFELYKKWGGQGGGGICSISRQGGITPALGLSTLGLIGLGLLRRRKRN